MLTNLSLAAGLLVFLIPLACGNHPGRQEVETRQAGVGPDEPALTNNVVLRFGVVTRAEPRLTVAGSQPLIDYLEETTPYRVELRMGRSSEDVELDVGVQDLVTFLEERLVEVAPLGVLSFCLADERFGAVALAQSVNDDGEPLERAAFIVAGSSDVRGLEDLRDKRVALGPSHSMLSHVLGIYELEKADVTASTSNLQSDEAVVEAVKRGDYDAGVVAEHLVDDHLRVVHRSLSIPSRPIVVRADLPEMVQASVRTALLELDRESTSSWDRIFRNGFAPSVDSDYTLVRQILNQQGQRCTESCHEPVRFGDHE